MKKGFVFILATIGIPSMSQNLVPNPNFEDTVDCPLRGTCPMYPGETCIAKYWTYPLQTPDYFHRCDTTNTNSVPTNNVGFQEDSEGGNAYIGIISRAAASTAYPGYSEMIGAKLIDSLRAGVKYFVSMKISLGDNSNCATNKVGFLFSTLPIYLNDPFNLPNYAHVYSNNIISDSLSWLTISGSFVADSNYKYIFLGNFFDNSHIDSIMFIEYSYVCNPFWCVDSSECWAYYYLDNVCVSEDSLYCDLGVSAANYHDSIENSVYPNPANDNIFIKADPLTNLQFSLFNLYGDELKTLIQGNETIDVSDIPSGIYLLKINHENRTVFTKQIIIH